MKTIFKLIDYISFCAVSTVLVVGFMCPVEAKDSWQEKMLFNPSAKQLELEQRGRVMIYDGLKDTQVAQAMDTQFDRIQSMMFVHTIVTNTNGEVRRDKEANEVVVEDDGC